MQALMIGLGKWLLTALIIPAIKAWYTLYNKTKAYNKKATENVKNAQEYEAHPTPAGRDAKP